MRVTDNGVYARMGRSVLHGREEAMNAQEKASSQLRVGRPSDDPAAFAQARRERSSEALGRAGASSAEAVSSQLFATDDALNSAGAGLSRARELAMRGATDTTGIQERSAIALEIREIRKQMLSFANAEIQGNHVFAGSATDKPAFAADGSFLGTTATREVEAYPGVRVQSTLPGGEAFGAGTGDDVFSTLDALANALESNDPAAARTAIPGIDTSTTRILLARALVGGMMNSVEVARSVAEKHADLSQAERSRLTDLDEVSAATDLLKATQAYSSAVAIAQKLPVAGLVSR